MTSSSVKLAHDDNLAIFVRPATTLVLTPDNYILAGTNANVNTPELMVYANSLTLDSNLAFPGKTLELHCNELDLPASTLIDVTGTPGQQVPAAGANPSANGGNGGHIILHVHNLRLHAINTDTSGNGGLAFWGSTLQLKVSGGQAGSYHKDSQSTDWLPGASGSPGTASIIYSNPLLRAYAALSDAYTLSDSLPARLGLLHTHCLPILGEELKATIASLSSSNKSPWLKTITDQWDRDFQDLRAYVDSCFNLHRIFVNLSTLLASIQLPDKLVTMVGSIKDFLKQVTSLKDYTLLPEGVSSTFEALQKPLQSWIALKPNSTTDSKDLALQYLQAEAKQAVDALLLAKNITADSKTPLGTAIENILAAFKAQLTKCEQSSAALCDLAQQFKISPISFSGLAAEDLAIDVPIVHPDQCSMSLRRADAAFFAEEYSSARSRYLSLMEKLQFVPRVSGDMNQGKQNATFQHYPQYLCLERMENEEGLSLWTFQNLEMIYKQVQTRINQISMGVDLFNLRKEWAPRLSFKYYFDYALQQLERLKSYENSYWQYFDQYQAQMEAGAVLGTALAVNVYQTRDAKERLQSDIDTIKRVEKEIDDDKTDYTTKANKLLSDLRAIEKELKDHTYVDPAQIVTAVGSLLVGIGLLFAGPVGWVGAGLMAGSVIAQSIGMAEDAKTKIKDSFGVVVNRNYVIGQLNTCNDDIDSLLKTPAYTMKADGTKVADANADAKIIATKLQVDSFLKQFKDKFPENKDLSKSLDDLVAAALQRNQKIVAYNNAVLDCYQQILQQSVLKQQSSEISSQLIRLNQGLPSIVNYYRHLRDEIRLAILRTIKHSVLALSFWGLRDGAKFTAPGLLSNVNELEAHIGVLQDEYESCLTDFGTFAQVSWPIAKNGGGIRYNLTADELQSLKIGLSDPFAAPNTTSDWKMFGKQEITDKQDKSSGSQSIKSQSIKSTPQIFTTAISGLQQPVRFATSLRDNPFAGQANVRISQVVFHAPGLCFESNEPIHRLPVEIRHEGTESITDPDDDVHTFQHYPIYLLSVTEHSMTDAKPLARQVMATDWSSMNLNAKTQAPIGPFASWRVVLREKDIGGSLNWTKVTGVYLEFEGSAISFRR